MREVSCKALGISLEVIRGRGVRLEEFFGGLPHPPGYFLVPENRIDWDTYVEVAERLQRLVGSDEELVALGRRFFQSEPAFLLGLNGRLLGSPRAFYKYLYVAGARPYFTNIVRTVRELPSGELELTARIGDGHRPCRQWFLISEGTLATAPTILGFPPSEVKLTTDGREGVFRIRMARVPSLVDRGRAMLYRVVGLKRTIAELERNNTLLQERYQALTDAQEKLSEQAVRLETVNEIGRLLSTELDLERLASAILRVMVERVGAKYAELRIVSPGEPFRRSAGTPQHAGEARRLKTFGREVGELVTDIATGEESRRASLLADLTPWFAAAVENALSWRRQQVSQVELEQRVRDRTLEVSAAYEQLKAYDDARAAFFANVSHELRTPLSLILAPAEVVLAGARGEISDAARLEVRTIHDAANRLLELTNQLLDHAALEANKLRLERDPLSFTELVHSLAGAMGSAAERARLTLRVELCESPAVVFGDPVRLERGVLNLLVNAVKYTPAGGTVTVRLRVEGGNALLEVADTGPGIAPEALPRLFDRFVRASDSPRRSGTGLGLALVKEVAELHEGTVAVRSEPGRGSTFTMTLPLMEDDARPRADEVRPEPLFSESEALVPAASAAPSDAPRILVVEDNPSLRALLVRELSSRYQVLAEADGEAGLALAIREKPQLIVSDVMMPRLSGLELVRRLKEEPSTKRIPVLLLTARRDVDDRIEGLGAGAVDYLVKPFAPRELHARIEVQLALEDATARLISAERLAGVGMLSAGFAHEVRNPLNGLLNAITPLQRFVDSGEAEGAREMLAIVSDCSRRLHQLANTMLEVARPSSAVREQVEVTRTLDAALRLMEFRARDKVEIVRDFGWEGTVPGDASALGQVWVNLIDNALRAMPDGGRLTVRTAANDGWCEVLVADTGCGIAEKDLPALFRPFFTTRDAGEGMGLGLSLCLQIVERLRGTIRVRASGPEGTAIEVRLPIDPPEDRAEPQTPGAGAARPTASSMGERA